MVEHIKDKILAVLPDATIYIYNPDDKHFQGIVISPSFAGMPLVKQHQFVMNALKRDFEDAVHALALKTFTPEKWEAEKHAFPSELLQ